jgi:hypothetical protein
MLAPAMRPRIALIAALALALTALAGTLSACGEEAETEVVEGEPLEIAGLSYNVQITRFLNPDDPEDAEYLVGQPPPEPGRAYLGVFMVIENEGSEPVASADDYTVIDTVGAEYEPLETESPYALEIGAEVPAERQLPIPDTTAATGPNQGSLLIFDVDDAVSDNRPLKLEIHTADGIGEVILDI